MAMSPEQLKEWSKKHNKFVRVVEGEPFVGFLQDARAITKDVNGETKEVIRFYFLPEDGGAQKTWDTQNGMIIEKLAGYMNKKIILTATGEGNKKRYEVALAQSIKAEELSGELSGNDPKDIAWEP